MSRAAGPLDAALVARLRQPGPLVALLGASYVWSGERPGGVDPDDYVLTDTDTGLPGTGAAFGQPGEGNTVDLDVWHTDVHAPHSGGRSRLAASLRPCCQATSYPLVWRLLIRRL